ncbi:putative PPPDE peptidase domain [Monocercomonoides exilis]|uniref:putative PPPDE peptidase domain n=1 Tax=Monocercomonoides exilis TaxID=2049356 RepID=UPI003559E7B7|nr:putative PPPDE peptidase domain [Monocercomonoides exilis]|eukprot:MONOS_1481.1-p1 / transcript=MONOS_1481.1 / gene=MONOS_1481 / organism=Monocercomonoides_exilis_PA203 / gene_product=unspecified product / transcript_product=unspecified product / location=Mono_scaffold00026:116024-118769(+) / protein_length=728 / sequence_SO=supercontig / SO=protein_coding / is_pseudo=false
MVSGYEYYYSGGIKRNYAGATVAGTPDKSISFGKTSVTQELFEKFLCEINSRYTSQTYHLFENNSTHFANDAVIFLTSFQLPSYVKDVTKEMLLTPIGQQVKPLVELFYGNCDPLKCQADKFTPSQTAALFSKMFQSTATLQAESTQNKSEKAFKEILERIKLPEGVTPAAFIERFKKMSNFPELQNFYESFDQSVDNSTKPEFESISTFPHLKSDEENSTTESCADNRMDIEEPVIQCPLLSSSVPYLFESFEVESVLSHLLHNADLLEKSVAPKAHSDTKEKEQFSVVEEILLPVESPILSLEQTMDASFFDFSSSAFTFDSFSNPSSHPSPPSSVGYSSSVVSENYKPFPSNPASASFYPPSKALAPQNPGILTFQDRNFLNSLQVRSFFESVSTNYVRRETISLPSGLVSIVTRLRCCWPAELLPPVLSLLRILALHSKGCIPLCKDPPSSEITAFDSSKVSFASEDNTSEIFHSEVTKLPLHAPLSVLELFRQFVLPIISSSLSSPQYCSASSISSSPFPSSGSSSSFPHSTIPFSSSSRKLTKAELTLCVICGQIVVNLISTPSGAKYLVSPNRCSFFLSVASSMVDFYSVAPLQQVGACIIHNIAMLLDSEKRTNQALCEVAIPSLCNAIIDEHHRIFHKEEESKTMQMSRKSETEDCSTETLEMLLKTLGVCCIGNDVGVKVIRVLHGVVSFVPLIVKLKDEQHYEPIQKLAIELLSLVS